MTTWKAKKLRKGARASRTKSTPAKMYIAIPPITGWPGGDPVKNGYRP